jgi:hypothetical protein
MSDGGTNGRGARGKPAWFQKKNKAGVAKKGYRTTTPGIESATFDTGSVNDAATFTKTKETLQLYVTKECQEGALVAEAIRTGQQVTVPTPALLPAPPAAPAAPAADADQDVLAAHAAAMAVFQQEQQRHADDVIMRNAEVARVPKRREALTKGVQKAFVILQEQCSPAVKEKLKGHEDWERVERDYSLHELIGMIRDVCVGFASHEHGTYTAVQAMKTLFLFQQRDGQAPEDYVRDLESLSRSAEHYGGSLGDAFPGLVQRKLVGANWVADQANITDAERTRAKEEIGEEVLASLIVSGSNNKKYSPLKKTLKNEWLTGGDRYPKTRNAASTLLANYEVPVYQHRYQQPRNDEAVAFLQAGGEKTGGEKSGGGGKSKKGGGAGGGTQPKVNSKGDSHCYNCQG